MEPAPAIDSGEVGGPQGGAAVGQGFSFTRVQPGTQRTLEDTPKQQLDPREKYCTFCGRGFKCNSWCERHEFFHCKGNASAGRNRAYYNNLTNSVVRSYKLREQQRTLEDVPVAAAAAAEREEPEGPVDPEELRRAKFRAKFHQSKKIKCPYCWREWQFPSGLKRHLMFCHGNPANANNPAVKLNPDSRH